MSLEKRDPDIPALLDRRLHLTGALAKVPYDLILYLERAAVHSDLNYPDLAAADAYRALLLTDEVRDEGLEYHEQARGALEKYSIHALPTVLQHGKLQDARASMENGDQSHIQHLTSLATLRCFQMLSMSLLVCGCLKSAYSFCLRGLGSFPHDKDLLETKAYVEKVAGQILELDNDIITIHSLPDQGLVRREIYPWNTHEPDRTSQSTLAALNGKLGLTAPKCEVRVSSLPILLEGASNNTDAYDTCEQLGLFAKEDIAPGEVVLREYSLLTANNRHKESTCDACGSELPFLTAESSAVSCPECHDTVFCDSFCFDKAQQQYHPAVCDRDVDAVAKDPDARDADWCLYLLLLSRLVAMAQHQDVHPLDLDDIKYLWGDFAPTNFAKPDFPLNDSSPPGWTLPFSFKYNIEAPLHILEKMDVDIYASLERYDLWVLNTAYSKFRGTASARKSKRDGRPDVAAVHHFWTFANHSCNPNVSWQWAGRMELCAREKRVLGDQPGGVRAGEEILNHYCDVNLDVQDRREWAKGSLGGWSRSSLEAEHHQEGHHAVSLHGCDDMDLVRRWYTNFGQNAVST